MPFAAVPFRPFSLLLPGGRLLEVGRPWVMGIVNATPDSLHASSRVAGADAAARAAERLVAAGADAIDLGACSTRPGSEPPSPAEETKRLRQAMRGIRDAAPGIPVSVDTWRADVARAAVEEMGADIVNDVSGGLLDPRMIPTVAALHVPYVLTHMRGTPATMASLTDYPRGVAAGVIAEIGDRLDCARQAGIADIILDPGFGFAKTVSQNYELLASLPWWAQAFPGVPVLVGVSRKSMLTKLMGGGATPDDVLPATTAANTVALLAGAAIIRVHDAEAACQARAVAAQIAACAP